MNQDEQRLDLLAIFHFVVGALTILFASIFLIYPFMGISMLQMALGGNKDAALDVRSWAFVAMGTGIVLAGWTLGILIIIAGRKLRARASRAFCLTMAAVECIIQPLGIILGVFTLIVLMRPSVIGIFEGRQAPAVQLPADS